MTIERIQSNLESLLASIDKREIDINKTPSQSYVYMFGITNFPAMLLSIPDKPSSYYLAPAEEVYDEWRQESEYVTSKGRNSIPSPRALNLIDYLRELQNLIYLNENRINWRKSLFSFLKYLRDDMLESDVQFLEGLFPYKKELKRSSSLEKVDGKIIEKQIVLFLKKLENDEYPIDILVYATIIKELINAGLNVRTNALLGAFEVLGFIWICFIYASHKIFIKLTTLISLKKSDLKSYREGEYLLTIGTPSGDVDIPISKTIFTHLFLVSSLHKKATIFSKSLPSLRRSFNTVVNSVLSSEKIGKVTLRTMLSMPHKIIGHRYKKRVSK